MLRTFSGRSFSFSYLRHIRGPWPRHYRQIVEKYSARPFLVSLENGARISKTYGEFDVDVRRVLHLLLHRHRDAGSLIVASENCYAMAVYLMAALLSGKTLCPLNPLEGSERLEQKRRQLDSTAVIFSRLNGHEPLVVPVEGALADPVTDADPARTLVHIFTSGSTGYAKIVEQTEAGILSNVDALITHHRLGENSVVATPLPLFHVNAFEFSFLCAFAAGGKFVLLQDSAPETIFNCVRDEGVRILSVIPSILTALLMRAKDHELNSLDYAVTAAAPLSVDLAKRFFERFQVRLIQGYGLSEAVNFSALMPIALPEAQYREVMFEGRHPSIGTALPGNSISILRDNGEECGENEEGEVAVRGWNVAKGYRDLEFSGEYLKTGDLGYYRTSGVPARKFFFISGRRKDVIKRFGETISLREVDDLILALGCEGVDAIAVSFLNTLAGDELGLVCRRQDSSCEDTRWKQELGERLARRIPVTLRPRVLIETAKPVRTPSGKPLRWAFQELFDKYKDIAAGANPFWG